MSLLRELQKYAITKDFFEEFNRTSYVEDGESKSDKTKGKQTHDNIKPKPIQQQKHENTYKSLFWTLYAVIENEHQVSMIENHEFKVKNDFSMKFVEEIKQNKGFLKQHKLRFHEIEASILYDKDINISTLKAIALFKKMNLFFIWNNRYYIFESNEDDPFDVIIREREKYRFERQCMKCHIMEKMVNNKLYMEDVRTQLKSMSSYKLDDLKIIAKTLGIDTQTKKTKQVLYEEINSKID